MPEADNLSRALEEVSFSIEHLESVRTGVNDAEINSKIMDFVTAARAIVKWQSETVRVSIADDLSGLLDGLRSITVPTHVDDIGRTPGLMAVRGAQGQVVMGLVSALEKAAEIGFVPTTSSFGPLAVVPSDESLVESFRGVASRIAELEASLNDLDKLRDDHAGFIQQADLISILVGTLRSEAKLARFLLRSEGRRFPLGALMRTLEAMTERTSNFWATIAAWRNKVSNGVLRYSERLRKAMRRVLGGAKTAINWHNRSVIRAAQQIPVAGAKLAQSESSASGSRGTTVAMYLPLLRRYARALFASQSVGDAYVAATLEALLANPSLLAGDEDNRIQLFRILNDICEGDKNKLIAIDRPLEVEKKLLELNFRPRQVFLLLALEGFDEEEVSQILRISADTVRAEMVAAGQMLSVSLATQILIVDPDEETYNRIASVVFEIGHEVLPRADTEQDAIESAATNRPGLLITEVQLKDGTSGLSAANKILESQSMPVIFVTKYPERFLTGPRPEPAFLISKPFQSAMLAAVISQALFFQRKSKPRSPR